MAKELSSRINPSEYEKSIYKFWLDKKLFHADEYSKKPADGDRRLWWLRPGDGSLQSGLETWIYVWMLWRRHAYHE